ncbi:MAG: secretin N-terminal domain-containing protein, partial [Nitrospinota bacterium]|nr:secretin N-terminal domain-containing protein [Nitrospinota bacterium]
MLTEQGSSLTAPDNSSLIIIDFANNVKWILEIINALDVNSLDKIQVKLFQVKFAFADEIAETLDEIFGSLGYSGRETGSGLKFIPIERLNSLIIINSIPEISDNIDFWISKLDKPGMEGLEEKIFIYYVQNTKASDLSGLLTELFPSESSISEGDSLPKGFRKSKKEPRKSKTTSKKKEKTPKVKAKPGQKKRLVKVKSLQAEEITGEVLFVSDEFTNALLIKTLPRNYPAILETIEQLDLMPLQVMIEVLVLELALDDSTRAGLDWAFKNGDLAFGSTGTGGFTVGDALGVSATAALSQGASLIWQTEKVAAMFTAFAQDSKLNVLSNPILITSNNKAASISITDDVPVQTSEITTP